MPIESIASALSLNEQQTNYNTGVGEQVRFVEQNARARETRPVEDAGDSPEAKAEAQYETTTKTVIDENNTIVFTRYDSEGREINRVPPGYDEKG